MALFERNGMVADGTVKKRETDSRNFYQRMEQEIDFDKEYRKLEVLLFSTDHCSQSLNAAISANFLAWRHRDIYTSFEELRDAVGFPVEDHRSFLAFGNSPYDMNDYFAYIEMITDILYDLSSQRLIHPNANEDISAIFETSKRVLSKVGYEKILQHQDCRVLVCKQDAAASAVAEASSQVIGDAVLEYNHYLLQGNIQRKRELLSLIALDLEPRRKEIRSVASSAEDNFFFLVNNLNIRHNNIDKSDKGNYRPAVVDMGHDTLEIWYDKTYRLAMYIYLSLENNQSKDEFKDLRDLITSKQKECK